jgi:hypothetical protein
MGTGALSAAGSSSLLCVLTPPVPGVSPHRSMPSGMQPTLESLAPSKCQLCQQHCAAKYGRLQHLAHESGPGVYAAWLFVGVHPAMAGTLSFSVVLGM